MNAPVDYELVVRVAAWELDEWAWVCARLEDWMLHCDEDIQRDYRAFAWPTGPKFDDLTWQLAAMADRMRRLASGMVTDPLA
ncbi:MAG: hypothetical protein ACRDYF_07455 [Acidimicrobiia bacterium]